MTLAARSRYALQATAVALRSSVVAERCHLRAQLAAREARDGATAVDRRVARQRAALRMVKQGTDLGSSNFCQKQTRHIQDQAALIASTDVGFSGRLRPVLCRIIRLLRPTASKMVSNWRSEWAQSTHSLSIWTRLNAELGAGIALHGAALRGGVAAQRRARDGQQRPGPALRADRTAILHRRVRLRTGAV